MSQYDHTTTTGEKLQVLRDEKFPWREKKFKTYRLARLYDLAGYPRYGDRVAACASVLEFAVRQNPDDILGEPIRALHKAEFCDLRLCPMCNARKAKRESILLHRTLEEARRRTGCRYLFLTLTVRNVPGPELGDAIGGLCKSWKRLVEQRQFERSFVGWFRAIEITRNREDGSYHPHIHAILAVTPGYFHRDKGLYITHADWVERWKAAARLDYAPTVRIQATKAKAKDGKRRKSADEAAAEEAAKYATKDAEYVGQGVPDAVAAEIVGTYTAALRRKRLTAYGGILKFIAQQLEAEADEGEGEEALEDATAFEWYRWHLGVNDYILDRVIAGPSSDCD